MARRRRGRSKFKHGQGNSAWLWILGIFLILLVVVIFGFVFYTYFDRVESHVALDATTHCPTSSPPTHITALIVDATDVLNEKQKVSVRNIVDRLVSDIPRYGALAIYLVSTRSDTQSQQIFYRCNPGRADDIDPVFGNPERVEYLWKTGFRNVLDEKLDENLDHGVMNASPIMESVVWVSIEHFDKPGHDEVSRTLAVISDFLQHTDEYSHYRVQPEFNSFENSQYYRKVRSNLINADVRLWQIRRNTERQNSNLEQFWNTYFRAQGASSVSFELLPG